MEIVYLLVPLAVILAVAGVWGFFWAVRSNQFDDLEGPAHRILMEEEPTATADDNNNQAPYVDRSD